MSQFCGKSSFIHSFRLFLKRLFKSTTTQKRSRHSTDTVSEFHVEAPQATVSEEIGQGHYVVARAGFELKTFRSKGFDCTNASPRPMMTIYNTIYSFSTLLKLNLFGWIIVDDWRMLTDAWSLKPFLALFSVIMSVTLGSSLTKNLIFQHTLINFPIVATINFASCVLFPVPYLMMQLLPWSMLLLLIGSIIAARFLLAYI